MGKLVRKLLPHVGHSRPRAGSTAGAPTSSCQAAHVGHRSATGATPARRLSASACTASFCTCSGMSKRAYAAYSRGRCSGATETSSVACTWHGSTLKSLRRMAASMRAPVVSAEAVVTSIVTRSPGMSMSSRM